MKKNEKNEKKNFSHITHYTRAPRHTGATCHVSAPIDVALRYSPVLIRCLPLSLPEREKNTVQNDTFPLFQHLQDAVTALSSATSTLKLKMSGGPVPVWKKYTTGSTGIWETFRKWATLVPNRSSGNPYVPFYRVPSPSSEKRIYKDARTIPASDIVENDFFARDNRRNHPQMSTFDQSKIGGLLKLGNSTNSRLSKGDEGIKQLATIKNDSIKLVDVLSSVPKNVIYGEVLGKSGEPIVAPNLNKKFSVKLLTEEEHGMYNEDYPVRIFKATS